ncbi:EexN family lipoprotein [Bartonella queenslandensis]|uniref:EexN family lipoprotein n=1 Tax=Bartonella queenslandensis TaxID=481138 RepID=UPI00030156CD|nr:EexN family lipoprotein [Bartonella queenslandensis]
MNKIIITALLLCTGLIIAGCEKTYSVEEFKKNEKLISEFQWKCAASDNSKNCQNVRQAAKELEAEQRKKANENYKKALEKINKIQEEREAKERAKAEQKEKEEAEKNAQ